MSNKQKKQTDHLVYWLPWNTWNVSWIHDPKRRHMLYCFFFLSFFFIVLLVLVLIDIVVYHSYHLLIWAGHLKLQLYFYDCSIKIFPIFYKALQNDFISFAFRWLHPLMSSLSTTSSSILSMWDRNLGGNWIHFLNMSPDSLLFSFSHVFFC